jgi:hypothetical protein
MTEPSPAAISGIDIPDLSGAMPLDTSVLHIVVPGTNKRTGWEVTFAGPSHPKTVSLSNELTRRGLDKAAKMEAAQVNARKWKPEDKQPDEQRRENVESVVARIVTWTPIKIAQVSAQPIAFSEKAAIDLLLRPMMIPYLMQMMEFLGNEASFIADSAKI